jgi:hypothetical protein
MLLFQGAGRLDQCLSRQRDSAAASGVVRVQGPVGVQAVLAADPTDRTVGETKLVGDLS